MANSFPPANPIAKTTTNQLEIATGNRTNYIFYCSVKHFICTVQLLSIVLCSVFTEDECTGPAATSGLWIPAPSHSSNGSTEAGVINPIL